jgi:IMP cyclohydrolase
MSAITWYFSIPGRKYSPHEIEMETNAPEPAAEEDIQLKYFHVTCAAQVQEQ